MDNRKFESGAGATPPSAPASPSSGYPTNGNPATSTPATTVGEYWFHQIGEELRAILSAAAIVPDNANLTQIKQALDVLYMSKNSGPVRGIGEIGANWNFDVWQCGTTFSIAGGTNSYTADQWNVVAGAGTNLTVTQQAGLNSQRNSIRIQRNAGNTGTGTVFLEQPLEAAEIAQMRGQKLTITFRMQKGADFSPSGSAVASMVACGTGPERLRGGGGFTSETVLSNTLLYPTASDTEFSFSTTVVIPANATQMSIALYWTPVGTAGANDWLQLGQFQLDYGTVKTANRVYDIDQVARKCRRYWSQTYQDGVAAGTVTNTGCLVMAATGANVNYAAGNHRFPAPMRAIPTLTFYSPANGAAGSWYRSSGGANVAVGVSSNGGATTEGCSFTNLAAVTTSEQIFGHLTANARM